MRAEAHHHRAPVAATPGTADGSQLVTRTTTQPVDVQWVRTGGAGWKGTVLQLGHRRHHLRMCYRLHVTLTFPGNVPALSR